jgi:membrane protein implicated in regulation of membrane protease activity
MTWSTFYLICFVVGLAFSFFSLLSGIGKLHLHFHGHFHGPHVGHGVGHAGGASHAATAVPRGSGGVLGHLGFFNFFSLMAFMAWFGGTGYLLDRYASLWFLLVLALATASGFAGAAVVFWFLAKVLLAHQTILDPVDFEMVGTLGRVGSPIRKGRTGEVIFPQAGTRKGSGARSEDGTAIERGAEVVITRFEGGIAYVRRWEDLTK